MRFLLAFVLSFISLFAIAQAPPMVLGGPQGIDVTRILSRNWMAIPVMTDTPAAPLLGSGWPGKGYIVHVAKANDTTVWHYTGNRWVRIGGVAENSYTKLISGGKLGRNANTNKFVVGAATYYINGVLYNSSFTQLNGFAKAANANGRIDIVALATTGPVIIQGTESPSPASPNLGTSRIQLGFAYYPPFDTLPTISGNGLESVFRKPGVDSIFFVTKDTIIRIKDSIGISKNDTAAMLNPYKFTASNGLTKDSTVFRLGGSLNQNTNINLSTRRLTVIGGNDTARFFANGRVSIGGTPDSTSMLNVNGTTKIKGNATYNGNLLPESVSAYSLGLTTSSIGSRLQSYTNGGGAATQYFDFKYHETSLISDNIVFDSIIFGYNRSNLKLNGIKTSQRGGGNIFNELKINPTIRIGSSNTQPSTYYGVNFEPIIDSANNVRFVPFSNNVGSNMLNVVGGNTRIGYNTFDTTYKLDVNGSARVTNGPLLLTQGSSSLSNINIKGRASANIVFETGGGNIVIGDDLLRSSFTQRGTDNILIGRSSAPALVGTLNDYIVGSSNIVIGRSSAPQFTTNAKGNVIIGHYAGKTTGIGEFPIGDSDYKFLLTGGASLLSGGEGYNLLYGDFLTGQLILNPTNGVDNPTINSSVQFGINSTTRGFLQPRMTNTQRDAITTPATGLQLFSTTDSANYVYRGTGGGWQKIANEISGSATLDFPSTNNGNESDLTITVTGASEGDVVSLGIPNSVNLNHSCFTAWVSATNTVTVRFNNYGTGALNPVSATFKVKVFK